MEFFIAFWQFLMNYGLVGAGIIFGVFLVLFLIWRGLVELRIFFRI